MNLALVSAILLLKSWIHSNRYGCLTGNSRFCSPLFISYLKLSDFRFYGSFDPWWDLIFKSKELACHQPHTGRAFFSSCPPHIYTSPALHDVCLTRAAGRAKALQRWAQLLFTESSSFFKCWVKGLSKNWQASDLLLNGQSRLSYTLQRTTANTQTTNLYWEDLARKLWVTKLKICRYL